MLLPGASTTTPVAMPTRVFSGALDFGPATAAINSSPARTARLPTSDQARRLTHTSQFFSTRQLSPAAFSELHTLAAAFIDTKGPIEAR
jgi:hypothetical protein